ncbi:unnamed protein product [Rotaria sp. Silwood2]|nr:unnamed protein product [Rotaria sp. Silwood2]CAF2491288.1 unnamed protein product [Rotaria sp. Silwood2]CAF2747189.1 unnamed protein product [Rotaria sp. Silwood2]CAF2873952.1 unnamed protein product [Rotaria sp. Silwood2]CAF3933159.1 unnamed protein product [Rotaria sp. Silwood2]
MESKRLAARSMLQRVVNLTKHAHDFQSSVNVPIPSWYNHSYRRGSVNFDQAQGLNPTDINQNPPTSRYILGPHRKFDFSRAQKLLQFEFNRQCAAATSKLIRYDPKICLELAQDLSQQLRRLMKPDVLNSTRYKIIVLVTIVQTVPNRQQHQSLAIVSRCLWNHETDGSITLQARLGYDMLAITTVFAVYTD